MTSTDAQFKRYLEVLLGDKDQEKVLEIVSKVDKSVRRGGDAANDNLFRRGRGRSDRRSVECYNCHQLGIIRIIARCDNRALATKEPNSPRAREKRIKEYDV